MDTTRTANVCGLLEVDPWSGERPETLNVRTCDLCGENVAYDNPRRWRTFYHDPAEGLNVCEFCVEDYLSEKP